MTVHHVDSLVDDYLHDLLSPDEAGNVERHCAECAACRDALEAARARLAALPRCRRASRPTSCIRLTLTRLETETSGPGRESQVTSPKEAPMKPTTTSKPRSPWHRRVWLSLACAAALAALVIGISQWRWQRYEPSPYDLRILGQNQLLQGAPASFRLTVFDRSRSTRWPPMCR